MTCKWGELTAHDLPAAVAAAQRTCIIAIGVLEKHGEHMTWAARPAAARG